MFFFSGFLSLGHGGRDGEDMALIGPAVTAVFLEFFSQGRCLGFLFATFKGVSPPPTPPTLDMSSFFSNLSSWSFLLSQG